MVMALVSMTLLLGQARNYLPNPRLPHRAGRAKTGEIRLDGKGLIRTSQQSEERFQASE